VRNLSPQASGFSRGRRQNRKYEAKTAGSRGPSGAKPEKRITLPDSVRGTVRVRPLRHAAFAGGKMFRAGTGQAIVDGLLKVNSNVKNHFSDYITIFKSIVHPSQIKLYVILQIQADLRFMRT